MAKQIVPMNIAVSESQTVYTIAFWYPISSGIRTQGNGSAWTPNGASLGASAAEHAAIQAGTILEEVESFPFPTGTPIADVQAVLLAKWTNRNAQLGGVGPNKFYGIAYDPTVNPQWKQY